MTDNQGGYIGCPTSDYQSCNVADARKLRTEEKSFRKKFREAILRWFDENKRELPWRVNVPISFASVYGPGGQGNGDKGSYRGAVRARGPRDSQAEASAPIQRPWRDPYGVWVSEIMLQQTRVSVVVGYYERFMKQFPDVKKLARASESSVLAAWSGLGYYRRARGLHAAAKIVVREHGGVFPTSAEEWRKLPGIGRYTAAAIASIAFGEKCAVVDGNVERVLKRVMGDRRRTIAEGEGAAPDRSPTQAQKKGLNGPPSFWEAAQELLSPERPGDFNEAMMELGAMVCVPGQPLCKECPVMRLCAMQGGERSGTREVRKKRGVKYGLAIRKNSVLLVRRSRTASLMPGMWELPEADDGEVLFKLRHAITNTDYDVTVVKLQTASGEWVPINRAGRLALTGLTRKVLRKAGIIQNLVI